ncbi:MAG: hypothetical protein RJA61_502 [Candidatus Parcubacteria bacterium]|jgi:tRNA G18 (ribose-2'-O)-methylase SpoU
MSDIYLILHNIRSTHNVGSIFRTADAAGVSKIYITGYTPTPLDRFNRPRKDISKVALGAEKTVAWEHNPLLEDVVTLLKKEGFSIIALEQSDNSVDYKTYTLKFPVALIVGNEVSGISEDTLNLCEAVIEIPMRGEKESLNVSVATGIALFQLNSKLSQK